MATELPRPGVEVVQEFASTSPTILTPTLVSCMVAPFFEVIEAYNSDGTVNEDSQLIDSYAQFELSIPQASFPSPRENIDEVDVQEDSIRCFVNFGDRLNELSRTAAFLTKIVAATTKASLTGTGTGPFDLDGKTLVFQADSHTLLPAAPASFPVSANRTVTFSATTPGGTLTITEVVDQINASLPNVASEDTGKLKLTSLRYGARSSVVVRYPGHNSNQGSSGASDLGFDTVADEYAVGPGLYAVDDNDGDLISPRLEIYPGIDQASAPYLSAPTFITDLSIQAGDSLVANGVVIGTVAVVTDTRLVMEVEQNLMAHGTPFAPQYVWVRANGLSYPAPAASQAANLTGTVQTSAASRAYVVGSSAASSVVEGNSMTVEVAEDGVAHPAETITVPTGDWADLAAIVGGINGLANYFQAYAANEYGVEQADGTYLGLRTLADNIGSGSQITITGMTANMATGIGFLVSGLPFSDIGENIRYLIGTPAFVVGAGAYVAPTISDTIATTVTSWNPMTNAWVAASETMTWATVPADLDDAVSDWNSAMAYTEAYKATSLGVEDVAGTYLAIRTLGESRGSSAKIVVTSTDTPTNLPVNSPGGATGTDESLDGKTFKWSIDGNPKVYEAVFVSDEDDNGTSIQEVISKINELTPGVAASSSDAPPYLDLTSQKVGESSSITIGDGDANALLGFTDNATTSGSGRPAPDLAIGTSGEAIIQGQLLRNGLTGTPFPPESVGGAPINLAYTGLRLDLSPDADNPGLLVIDSLDTLETVASPVSTDNPGALMVYLAKLNSPSNSVAAIGVPYVSADAPDGTPSGYAKCFEFLQSKEVYALALASHNPVIHQSAITHALAMSEPEQKGERIVFINPEIPTRSVPEAIGSGTDANSTGTQNEIMLDLNIAPALIAAGLDPDEDLNPASGAIENEVYLDLGSDANYYLVKAVENGTKLTLRTSFSTGDGNEDSFYTSTTLDGTIVSDDWTVYIRGEELLIPGSTLPNRTAQAETIQAVGQAYGERRAYMVHPDQCKINVTGLEQLVEGYYATACIAGMVGNLPPQQGFTNYPITGLTGLVGSNDVFTESQMNVMAAGGAYVLVQDADGAPIISRHQLSTDLTSIETRELSITKVLDYVSKFLRIGIKNFIGRSNITQPFLDNLSAVVQGLLEFLKGNGNIIGAEINNLIQDSTNPDTVLIDITVDVPYPCNYVRITLVI